MVNIDLTLVQTFAAAHPFLYGAGAMAAGALAPRLLDFAATDGVDWLILRGLALQKRALLARGASPEQIRKVEEYQASMLQRAADDVKKDALAQGAPDGASKPSA